MTIRLLYNLGVDLSNINIKRFNIILGIFGDAMKILDFGYLFDENLHYAHIQDLI